MWIAPSLEIKPDSLSILSLTLESISSEESPFSSIILFLSSSKPI